MRTQVFYFNKYTRVYTYVTNVQQKEKMKRLLINVSGATFEISENCLLRYPNTLLGDVEKRSKYYIKDEDLYFFNRHRLAFEGILLFYQTFGRISCPPNVPTEIFQAELEFFKIDCEFLQNLEDAKAFVTKEAEEEIASNNANVKARIWNILQNPGSSTGAQILSGVSLLMTMTSIGLACHTPANQNEKIRIHRDMFPYETVCFVWFTLEFLLRFLTCPSKINLFKNWIDITDLATLIIFYSSLALTSTQASSTSVLRIFRLANAFRVFRLTRFSNGLRLLIYTIYMSRTDLQLLSSFMCFFILITGSCVYFTEVGNPDSQFSREGIFSGFWFSLISCTTVGYGDIVPITPLGKIVSAFTMTFGAMFILLPVLKLVSAFSDALQATKNLLNTSPTTTTKTPATEEEEEEIE